MKKILVLCLILLCLFTGSGCKRNESSAQEESKKNESSSQEESNWRDIYYTSHYSGLWQSSGSSSTFFPFVYRENEPFLESRLGSVSYNFQPGHLYGRDTIKDEVWEILPVPIKYWTIDTPYHIFCLTEEDTFVVTDCYGSFHEILYRAQFGPLKAMGNVESLFFIADGNRVVLYDVLTGSCLVTAAICENIQTICPLSKSSFGWQADDLDFWFVYDLSTDKTQKLTFEEFDMLSAS